MSWLVSMVWKYPCWFCKRRHSCFWAEGSKIIDIVTEVQEVSRPSHLCAGIWALGAKYSGTPCICVLGQRARSFAIRTCISCLCLRVQKLRTWVTRYALFPLYVWIFYCISSLFLLVQRWRLGSKVRPLRFIVREFPTYLAEPKASVLAHNIIEGGMESAPPKVSSMRVWYTNPLIVVSVCMW